MIAPLGSWVSSLRVRAERLTVSRQRPLYVDWSIQLRQYRAVCANRWSVSPSWRGDQVLALVEDLEHEQRLLALVQRHLRRDGAVAEVELVGRGQAETQVAAGDEHAVLDLLRLGVHPAVVGSGGEVHPQVGLPAYGGDPADDALPVVGVVGLQDRHEVVHLGDAALGHEPGDEDVGVGEVELARPDVLVERLEAPVAALLGVEDAAEDAGGVEARRAEPVDGAVRADERAAAEVADQPVLRDRQEAVNPLFSHAGASPRPAAPAPRRDPTTRARRTAASAARRGRAGTPPRGAPPRRRG